MITCTSFKDYYKTYLLLKKKKKKQRKEIGMHQRWIVSAGGPVETFILASYSRSRTRPTVSVTL